MSIAVMTLVWRSAPYQGNTLLALLALADWSDDKGVSWPGVETLAKKSRQSERNIRIVLHRLRADGFLSIIERKGTSSKYVINLHRLEGCKVCTPEKSARGGQRLPNSAARFAPNTSFDPSLKPPKGVTPKILDPEWARNKDLRRLMETVSNLKQMTVGSDRFGSDEEFLRHAATKAGVTYERALDLMGIREQVQ